MNLSTSILSPAAALLGVALLASFQNPGGQSPGGQKPSGTRQPATNPAGQDPLSSQTMNLQRADRLVGMDLSDSTGAPLGKVQDLVLNADGTVGFVVVQAAVNGQTRLYPISWHVLQFQTDPGSNAGKLMTNFPKDRLDSAPNFATDQWPKEGADTVFTEADTFFGHSSSARMPPPEAGDRSGRPQQASMRIPVRFRSSTIGTTAITDPSGAPLGTLGQVVVDPMSGRVAYATVSLSGGNVVAVPWTLLQTSQDRRDQLQLAFPQDRLQNAPQFQSGEANWKQMSDPAWVGQVYSYYSVPPYWKSDTRTPATKTPPPQTPPPSGGEKPPPPKSSKPPSGG